MKEGSRKGTTGSLISWLLAERQVQTPGSLVDSQPARGSVSGRLPVKTWKGLERVYEAICHMQCLSFANLRSLDEIKYAPCHDAPKERVYNIFIQAIHPSFQIRGAIALLKAPGKLRSTCRGLTPQRPFTVDTCGKSWRRHLSSGCWR